MDLANSAFIRKVLIKRERREDFQKILPAPPPSSESVYSLERLLVLLLAIWKPIGMAAIKIIMPLLIAELGL